MNLTPAPSARAEADRLLRDHPTFGAVPADDRRALLGLGRLEHASDGEPVFLRGDRYRGAFLLLQGLVEVHRTTPEGRRLVLEVARPGTLFALAPLCDASITTYASTADAVEAAALWCLPVETAGALTAERPALARALLRRATQTARALADRLEHVALYRVPERLARYVLDHADPDGALVLEMRKATLAAYLGTVPETLSRALQTLCRDGLVAQRDGCLVVTDAERLRELARR